MRRPLAEFLGTFILVFAGHRSHRDQPATGGVIGHAGIALTFGLVVLAMIYTFGDISGAHLQSRRHDRLRRGQAVSVA